MMILKLFSDCQKEIEGLCLQAATDFLGRIPEGAEIELIKQYIDHIDPSRRIVYYDTHLLGGISINIVPPKFYVKFKPAT